MGLFSFLKSAGKSIFGSKAKEAPAPVESFLDEAKLKQEIANLGLPVSHLAVAIEEGTVTVYGDVDSTTVAEKIILAVGNVEGVECVDDRLNIDNPEPEAVFYTVQSGDTLSKISKAQYGDPMKYNAIFEANRPMLTHPDKIYPGQVLRIPPLG